MNSKRNVRAVLNSLCVTALIAFVVLGFNNCSPEHAGVSSQPSSGGLQYWTCDDQLDDVILFNRTYHQFLMNRCAECHAGGGQGPGAFANSGIELAYNSFQALGFSRINSRSLDGHSPASGATNRSTIDDLTARYVDGLATIQACAAGGGDEINENQDDANRLRFVSKAINPDLDEPVTVSWNIATETIAKEGFDPSTFAGMRLEVDIQVFQRPGIINYVVSNPRLRTNNGDVRVRSLLFKLNGKPTPAQRAFYLVNTNIRSWDADHPDFGKADPNPETRYNDYEFRARLISGGALVVLGEVRSTDVISVSVAELERVELPPPDLGPLVSFGQTTMQVVEDYSIVSIPIVLDREATEPSSVEVVFGGDTTIKDECCRTTLNDDGQQIQVRHFDRDIQDYDLNHDVKINRRVNFDQANNRGRYLITFREGETAQVLNIKIVGDDRDELNEVLHLRIDGNRLNKLRAAPTNQDFRLTIVDNDQPYTGSAETYTMLLSDGGLLAQECLRCHNSVLFRGGYDITAYETMVRRGILIPGNTANSLMFKRIDANIPGLAPMPLTGLMSPLDRSRVAQWILNGALNN